MSPPASSSSSSDFSDRNSISSVDDFESTIDAISLYSRQIHLYTKRQLDLAKRSAPRRPESTPLEPISSFSPESSVDSNDS